MDVLSHSLCEERSDEALSNVRKLEIATATYGGLATTEAELTDIIGSIQVEMEDRLLENLAMRLKKILIPDGSFVK